MAEAVTLLVTRACVCLLIAGPIAVPDRAGAVSRRSAERAFALTVTPGRMVITADQLARERHFTVTNGAAAAVEVVVRTASFVPGPDGAPVLRADAPRTAAGWATLQPDRLHLAGGEAQQVTLGIAVPVNAEPGEYQLAVVFSVPAAADQAGIAVTGAIGAPVYISVSGEADESLDILGLASGPVGWSGGILAAWLSLWLLRRRIRRGAAPTSDPASVIVDRLP